MKEFEKRWNCGMLSRSSSALNSGANAKEAAQFIWRAALEMVIESDRVWMEDLYADIEKELKDED